MPMPEPVSSINPSIRSVELRTKTDENRIKEEEAVIEIPSRSHQIERLPGLKRTSNTILNGATPTTDVREDCLRIARRAREAFTLATAPNARQDDADAAFAVVGECIAQLWEYAKYRDQPFKDLLAAVEISVRGRTVDSLSASQETALFLAVAELPRWHLDALSVEKSIDQLTDAQFDLLAPVKALGDKKIRISVTVEE